MSDLPYVVDFRGHPACPCLAEWLPVYESELQRRGILRGSLTIYQLIGGAAASAGTHSEGGAFDLLDLPGDEEIWVGRQMGADALWSRPYNWDGQGGMDHDHGVLRGCPHNGPARYQIAAVDAGFNGLGHLGEGGRDTGPRPLSYRTWREGIAWAQAQEDPMADYAKQLDNIQADVVAIKARLDQGLANSKKRDQALRKVLRERFHATDDQLDEILAQVDQDAK